MIIFDPNKTKEKNECIKKKKFVTIINFELTKPYKSSSENHRRYIKLIIIIDE